MSRQLIPRPPSVNRNQPLLHPQSSSVNKRFAEVAGNTTAECAAIFCCCPCGIVNLLVLAVYKLPAGLCRRALKKNKRRKLVKQGLLTSRHRRCSCGCDDTELQIHPTATEPSPGNTSGKSVGSPENEVMDLEEDMWGRFYGTGFWRSPSQRE